MVMFPDDNSNSSRVDPIDAVGGSEDPSLVDD